MQGSGHIRLHELVLDQHTFVATLTDSIDQFMVPNNSVVELGKVNTRRMCISPCEDKRDFEMMLVATGAVKSHEVLRLRDSFTCIESGFLLVSLSPQNLNKLSVMGLIASSF